MRCPNERYSEPEAGLLEHDCISITPKSLGVNGLSVSNSLSDAILSITLPS